MNSTKSLLKTLIKNPSPIKTKSQAKQLHAQIIKLKHTSFTTSTVLSVYSNLNLLHESLILFNSFHPSSSPPTSLAFKSIIKCYSSNGFATKSLNCFVKMLDSGLHPDHNVFPSVLKSCTLLMDLKLGESVHGWVVKLGLDFDLYTCNALMNLYSKLENFSFVHKVFDEIPHYDSTGGYNNKFSCTTKSFDPGLDIKFQVGEVCCDNSNGLINVYEKMASGSDLIDTNDGLIHISVDREVASESGETSCRGSNGNGDLNWGILRKSGVSKVFETMPKRDLVSWNTVISGNAQNGMFEETLTMVMKMGEANLKPDSFTLSSVLPIFAQYVDISRGKEIHCYSIRHGFDSDVYIGSSLIDMYAKCTRVEDSRQVFFLLPQLDSISWNSIIAGCVQNGCFDEGLILFRQMLKANVKPKQVSFSSIMPACAHLTTLHLGKQLHGYIVRVGFDDNKFIASSLVDMYAKCGNIKTARWIYDSIKLHDMVSCTAMIMGYASHGHADEAISLFDQMKSKGVAPNYVAFVAVLTACSHAGLVNKAWEYFNCMIKDHHIQPGLEHYAAMADLLGRAGKLTEAYNLISNMHIKTTASVWSTLLAACRVHKNVEMGEKVAEKILFIEPDNMGAYVLLSNIYSAVGRWGDMKKLRTTMRDHGLKKEAACSWIEVKNNVHSFISGDKSHPLLDSINMVLGILLQQMEQEGYALNPNAVDHDA